MRQLLLALALFTVVSCKEEKKHTITIQGVGFIDTNNIPVGKIYEFGRDSDHRQKYIDSLDDVSNDLDSEFLDLAEAPTTKVNIDKMQKITTHCMRITHLKDSIQRIK